VTEQNADRYMCHEALTRREAPPSLRAVENAFGVLVPRRAVRADGTSLQADGPLAHIPLGECVGDPWLPVGIAKGTLK
jgi:hypothetical protein